MPGGSTFLETIANMSDKIIEPEVEHASETHTKPSSRFTRWYRSPLFNVIIVGLISFTQPGIWNALNSMLPFLPTNSCSNKLQMSAQAANKSPTSSTVPIP
jgi:hypothetical protein